jgi:hypothetical protein
MCTLKCDGVDLTPKIKDLKLHCLLFLNIPKLVALILAFLYSQFFIKLTLCYQVCRVGYVN